MATTVGDVLSADIVTISAVRTVRDAAELMRAADIGAVVVTEGGQLVGLVTDRDLVVRVLADGGGPDTSVRSACSADPVTISPDADVADAARVMAEHTVRRLLVVADDKVVGMVSLGDLAMTIHPRSVLGQVSAGRPNA
jgi:CBS domain-containing protein